MAELKDTTESPSPRVRVSIGYTRNMGDFESLRYDVSVESGCLRGETTEAAYNRITAFVEEKLMNRLKEIEEAL